MFSLFLNDLFPGYIEMVTEIVTPVVVTHQVDRNLSADLTLSNVDIVLIVLCFQNVV